MVASNHPIASAAGVEMLALGGNAIDAAVATAFTLTVVEPMMVSIFGAGLINFYHAAGGQFIHIDNYTVAPGAATPDMFEPVSDTCPYYMDAKDQANRFGFRAVGVAGTLKAWCRLEEQYGKLGLDAVMQPTIRHAARGFAASGYMLEFVREYRSQLDRFPASRAVFLPGGAVPSPGQRIVRGDYARTLQLIADEGPDALYGGTIGEMVADDMAAHGGLLTLDDLRDYCIQPREPVRGTYRGYEIVSMAPTSSGGTHIIQVLNLLEAYDIGAMGFGTAQTLHLLAESLKIAFADRFQYMGDPAFVDVPLRGLTSKEYAAVRRKEIDPNRAQDYRAGRPRAYNGESGNTTHFTVADADGNVVALTQTLNGAFGSCVTTLGTGMLLNNTMHLFDPHPGHANSVAPRKRMLSSMSPTIVMKDGKPFMALGTPGGTRIFAAVLQAISNVIDHGMTLQEAVEAPRIWTQGEALNVEPGIAPEVRAQLEAKGHKLELTAKVAGGMNGILFDHANGLMHGAACWRADGAPAGLSGGWARKPEAGMGMPVV
jgi:gamma-glutamyltranspeptidase/glutathione hydrolase